MDDTKKACPTCGGRRIVWTKAFGGWLVEPCPTCNAGEQPVQHEEAAS